jgi:hypothetical protein
MESWHNSQAFLLNHGIFMKVAILTALRVPTFLQLQLCGGFE